MNHKWTILDLLIGAMEKLSPKTGERQNVLAFIQSCYGGQVRYTIWTGPWSPCLS